MYKYVFMLIIHSTIVEHLICFQFFEIKNNPTLNILINISWYIHAKGFSKAVVLNV